MPQKQRIDKPYYRTNVGDNAYVMLKNGKEENKRFHVLLNPEDGKAILVYSGPEFGEACQQLFMDGFARHTVQPKQSELQPKFLKTI